MLATPWGYDVDTTEIDPLVSLAEFHEMTGSTYSADSRIESALVAVSSRIRGWCGWHVAPSLSCELVADGGERIMWLPAALVTDVDSVTVSDEEIDTDLWQWSRRGELRIPATPDVLGSVVIDYTAGYADVPEDLKLVVVNLVRSIVGLPYGVVTEMADGVSVSYSASAVALAGGLSLSAGDLAALAPYRLVKAHAA